MNKEASKFFLISFCLFLIGCASGGYVLNNKSGVSEGVAEGVAEGAGGTSAAQNSNVSNQYNYVNNKFSFALNYIEDYKIEILDNDAGILMKKWFEYEHPKQGKIGYKVEIVVLPFENILEYRDISDFIAAEYSGYTIEFKDKGELKGVFVDEGVGGDALRHFFCLSKDRKIMYEVYLKCLSTRYSKHKNLFDKFVDDLEIF